MNFDPWLGFALASAIAVAIAVSCAVPGARLGYAVRRPAVRLWFNRARGGALIGAGRATAAGRRA